MKILEAQSSHLTNYEVLTHLEGLRARYDEAAAAAVGTGVAVASGMKCGNLETVMKELTDYLRTPPSPLHRNQQTSSTSSSSSSSSGVYNADTPRRLFTALRPFALTKAELLMILNVRPANVGVLDTIVEEMDIRYGNLARSGGAAAEEEQEEQAGQGDPPEERILRVVAEVLGVPDADADADVVDDVGPLGVLEGERSLQEQGQVQMPGTG